MDSSYLAARGHTLDRARTPAPITNVGTVSAAWLEVLGLSVPDSVSVNDDNVRGLPALDRAKGLVVNSVATMLVDAAVCTEAGDEVAKPVTIRRPHPVLQSFEFFEQVVDSLVMHGNYVAVRLDPGSDDEQLVPVPLGAVSVDASSGLPWYTINGMVYRWDEVFHPRAHAPVGTWWGRGVVEKFRRSLSEHLHSQAYGETSFRSGSVPSLSVELDVDTPTEDQVTKAKAGVISKFGAGQREPMVHGRGMKLTPLSWSPHDAEFVESRKITLAEAALMVGLRPEDIGASLGNSMTYGNRQDDALQRIVDAYGPWLERVEGPLSDLLSGDRVVKGNPEALLRLSVRESEEIETIRIANAAARSAVPTLEVSE